MRPRFHVSLFFVLSLLILPNAVNAQHWAWIFAGIDADYASSAQEQAGGGYIVGGTTFTPEDTIRYSAEDRADGKLLHRGRRVQREGRHLAGAQVHGQYGRHAHGQAYRPHVALGRQLCEHYRTSSIRYHALDFGIGFRGRDQQRKRGYLRL